MKINPMHSMVCYGPHNSDNTVYLTNIENDNPTDLISFPCPAWGDRKELGEQVRIIGHAKGLC